MKPLRKLVGVARWVGMPLALAPLAPAVFAAHRISRPAGRRL